MREDFPLHPDVASTAAAGVDALYFFLIAVSGFFTLLIFVLIVYFALYYRDGRNVDRTNQVHENTAIETTWSLIPLVLVMIMFGWGAVLFVQGSQPPANAMTIDVIGKQWMWRIYHANGQREINELHVPVNQPVKLRMISDDVIHSFYIPAFRTKMDVLPGRHTQLWFTATRPGRYHLFCAEYCGTDHSRMRGSVVVMEPGDFADWMRGATDEAPETAGARIFEEQRCHNCHHDREGARGPKLAGLYGSTVRLESGEEIVADEQYLRDSILNPALQVVAGYKNEMPLYRGRLSEEDVLHLTAYIKSLPATEQATQGP